MTLLVADDDPTNLLLFARFVRDLPYRLVSCVDGNQGLLLWRQERPDIAFLDLKMPGKSGQELARLFREEDPEHRCQRIAMSALTAPLAGIDLSEGLWDDFLEKPVSRTNLLFFLSKHLS